jgi:hypothetical protein
VVNALLTLEHNSWSVRSPFLANFEYIKAIYLFCSSARAILSRQISLQPAFTQIDLLSNSWKASVSTVLCQLLWLSRNVMLLHVMWDTSEWALFYIQTVLLPTTYKYKSQLQSCDFFEWECNQQSHVISLCLNINTQCLDTLWPPIHYASSFHCQIWPHHYSA